MGRPYPAPPVWRVALWLMLVGAGPGWCAWDTMSERHDGVGSGDAHSNGKVNEINGLIYTFMIRLRQNLRC